MSDLDNLLNQLTAAKDNESAYETLVTYLTGKPEHSEELKQLTNAQTTRDQSTGRLVVRADKGQLFFSVDSLSGTAVTGVRSVGLFWGEKVPETSWTGTFKLTVTPGTATLTFLNSSGRHWHTYKGTGVALQDLVGTYEGKWD